MARDIERIVRDMGQTLRDAPKTYAKNTCIVGYEAYSERASNDT